MQEFVSPKQVAQAIGVSESSLKRWCDQGVIPVIKTAGGHRRIQVNAVLDYLRKSGHPLSDPEVLGLPAATTGGLYRDLKQAREQLTETLIAGDESASIQIVLNLYLANYPLSVICDDVFAASFQEIGNRWGCGTVAVYQERRSCELCLRILHEMRRVLPELPPNAPIAVGGTLDGDPYTLATAMVELVLRDLGWRACSLGNMLPFGTLRAAVCDTCPRLFWLSVSSIRNQPEFVAEFEQLSAIAHEHEIAVVVGGKGLTQEVRQQIDYCAYCDNFRHLASFARQMMSAPIHA